MFSKRFDELTKALQGCSYSLKNDPISEDEALKIAFKMLAETVHKKGIVYVIGNGGSAGIASHFSNDLMKALQIPSQTLYDPNLLTCLANDLGYEHIFSYPLKRYLKSNDLLVAVSSSGKSLNIVKAAEIAILRKVPLITFTGFQKGNPLKELGDLNFWIDRTDYGLVETSHFFLLHSIIDLWNKRTSPVTEYAQIFESANAN